MSGHWPSRHSVQVATLTICDVYLTFCASNFSSFTIICWTKNETEVVSIFIMFAFSYFIPEHCHFLHPIFPSFSSSAHASITHNGSICKASNIFLTPFQTIYKEIEILTGCNNVNLCPYRKHIVCIVYGSPHFFFLLTIEIEYRLTHFVSFHKFHQ